MYGVGICGGFVLTMMCNFQRLVCEFGLTQIFLKSEIFLLRLISDQYLKEKRERIAMHDSMCDMIRHS